MKRNAVSQEHTIMSTPFIDEEFTFTNPDGSTIRLRGTGNQYYAVFETLDGYTVVRDDTGFYRYASLSDDKNRLVPTSAQVGEADPQTLGLQRHIRIRRDSARQQAMQSALRQGTQSRWQIRRAEKHAQRRSVMPTTSPDALPQFTVT